MPHIIYYISICYYRYMQFTISLTVHKLTIYLLINHCLTRWAVTFCPTYGDCRAAIKHSQVGFFTLSSWFSHASITCHPNSSSDSSLLRVDDFNPNLRPSLRYLLTVRSDSCSRTSSRSSLAIKDNIIHELIIFIMLVYQHVSLTQCLLGYLIYTSSILTSSWFFMCCSHEYNESVTST